MAQKKIGAKMPHLAAKLMPINDIRVRTSYVAAPWKKKIKL